MKTDKLIQLLDYNRDTGVFVWKVNSSYNVKKGFIAGTLQSTGYIDITIFGKQYKAHRLAWLYIYGEWPKKQIDHINGDKSDNRIINLRDVGRNVNSKNNKIDKRNKFKCPGIYYHKTHKKICAVIGINNRQKHLYCGDNLFEAICRRKSAEIMNGYHVNHGRR